MHAHHVIPRLHRDPVLPCRHLYVFPVFTTMITNTCPSIAIVTIAVARNHSSSSVCVCAWCVCFAASCMRMGRACDSEPRLLRLCFHKLLTNAARARLGLSLLLLCATAAPLLAVSMFPCASVPCLWVAHSLCVLVCSVCVSLCVVLCVVVHVFLALARSLSISVVGIDCCLVLLWSRR